MKISVRLKGVRRYFAGRRRPLEAEMLTTLQGKEIYNIQIIPDSSKFHPRSSRQVEFRGAFSLQGQEIPVTIHTHPECKCVEWGCPKGSGCVGGILFSFTSFQKAPKRVFWDLW